MKRYYVRRGKLREALDIIEILRKVRKKKEDEG
jgi:hypothetical protein